MTLEETVEYFSILGGVEDSLPKSYFDNFSSIEDTNFIEEFDKFQSQISPSYLTQSPYSDILIAVARGDGKINSVIRKSKLSKIVTDEIIKELISLNILKVQYSREAPLKKHPKQKLKKEFRSYRISHKLIFVKPFFRFWFGFVIYYTNELKVGDSKNFIANFNQHNERLVSLVYEQLSNDFLIDYYAEKSPIISSGNYWNIKSEFDILALRRDNKLILAECKYKNRKICKNELTKLKLKAKQSGIDADIYILFSKSGFSKELLHIQDKDLLLFDLSDLKSLLLERGKVP